MKVEDAIKELQALGPNADLVMITVTKRDYDDANDDAAREGHEYGVGRYVEPIPAEEWTLMVNHYEQNSRPDYIQNDIIEYLWENPVVADETG